MGHLNDHLTQCLSLEELPKRDDLTERHTLSFFSSFSRSLSLAACFCYFYGSRTRSEGIAARTAVLLLLLSLVAFGTLSLVILTRS